jgi:hypothetical protein
MPLCKVIVWAAELPELTIMHVTCERARTQIESMHVNVWKIEPRRGRPDNNRPSHGCVHGLAERKVSQSYPFCLV